MLTIGNFSRATLLTIKTLRHYHDTGLLEAAEVDPQSGYRRYLTSQIPQAQLIKRFRELQMPLSEIRQVLASPEGSSRNAIMAAHFDARVRPRTIPILVRGAVKPLSHRSPGRLRSRSRDILPEDWGKSRRAGSSGW